MYNFNYDSCRLRANLLSSCLRDIQSVLINTPASQQPWAKHIILDMVARALRDSKRISMCKVDGSRTTNTRAIRNGGDAPTDQASDAGEEGKGRSATEGEEGDEEEAREG